MTKLFRYFKNWLKCSVITRNIWLHKIPVSYIKHDQSTVDLIKFEKILKISQHLEKIISMYDHQFPSFPQKVQKKLHNTV